MTDSNIERCTTLLAVMIVFGMIFYAAHTSAQVERTSPPTISIIAAKQLSGGFLLEVVKIGNSGCALLTRRAGEWGYGSSAYSPSSSVTTLPTETCNGK